MNLSFNATVESIAIDSQQLHFKHTHNISSVGEKWEHSVGREYCTKLKCLVADIGLPVGNTNTSSPFVHLIVKLSLHYDIIAVIMLTLMFIVLCLFFLFMCRKKIQKKFCLYKHYNCGWYYRRVSSTTR